MNTSERTVDSYGRCQIVDNDCHISRPWDAYTAPAGVAPVLEGDVHQPTAAYYTYGTDLAYVLDAIDAVDPIDIESEDPTDTDYDIHRTLNHVRASIKRRLAVQAGPRDVDYCGADGNYGRACGPDLGLPPCAYHARTAERDMTAANRPELTEGSEPR